MGWRAVIVVGVLVLAGCRPLLPVHDGGGLTARLAVMLAGTVDPAQRPDGGRIAPGIAGPLPGNWRRADTALFLSEDGPAPGAGPFRFSALQADEIVVTLNSVAARPLDLRLTCDGPWRASGLRMATVSHVAGDGGALTLPAGATGAVRLTLDPATAACDLNWGAAQLRLEREDMTALDAQSQGCTVPRPRDALEAAFYADRWLSQTCPLPAGPVRMLPDALDALAARAEALIGSPLSRAALMSGDPDQPLDFSRAPRLDLIVLSALHVRADYSGWLTLRMLAHHAAQGTPIRIMVTDLLMLPPDRRLYESFAAQYPGVQIQYFQWSSPLIDNPVDRLQRAHHVKLFATLSPEPGRSRAIVGGRNLHDGFFFAAPFDLTAHPVLRTYGAPGQQQGLAFYSTYEDFEVELSGDATVRALLGHFATLWHRDRRGQVARPFSAVMPGTAAPMATAMRHFISLPWADGGAHEVWLTEVLDAAQEEIIIVSPFLNPTPAVLSALIRAAERGVRVQIVTRADVLDPAGVVVAELNRRFAAAHADRFDIRAYQPDAGRMLHAKLLVVDGRLGVVTSSNFNQRSLLHDSENGLVFLDPVIAGRLRAQAQDWITRGVPLTRDIPLRGDLDPLMQVDPLWQYF